MEIIKMKLTKKEQEFLLEWLSDDLHIELEKEESDFPNPIARKLLPKIIKKLTPISKGNCHGCNETMKMDEISQKNENYCISCIN